MFIDPPPQTDRLDELIEWCEKLQQRILLDDLYGSATWDPSSIAAGAEEAKEVTVIGAVVGDYAVAAFSQDVSDLTLDAQVTGTNIVTCVLANNTGGAIDLASGTIYARVFKRVQ